MVSSENAFPHKVYLNRTSNYHTALLECPSPPTRLSARELLSFGTSYDQTIPSCIASAGLGDRRRVERRGIEFVGAGRPSKQFITSTLLSGFRGPCLGAKAPRLSRSITCGSFSLCRPRGGGLLPLPQRKLLLLTALFLLSIYLKLVVGLSFFRSALRCWHRAARPIRSGSTSLSAS